MAAAPSPTLLFVNLPVRDRERSVAFCEAIGAVRNPRFSDHTAACMALCGTIFVMLPTHGKFAEVRPGRRSLRHRADRRSWLHARPEFRRSRRSYLGSVPDGPGGDDDPQPR